MKKFLLLLIAALSVCTAAAQTRSIYFYQSDGSRLYRSAEETNAGSNIFEVIDVYTYGGISWLSLELYETPEALQQGIAAGNVYSLGNIRDITPADNYSQVNIERCALAKASSATSAAPKAWAEKNVDLCVDLTTGTLTKADNIYTVRDGDTFYHYYIKKNLMPGVSLASSDDKIAQLYIGEGLPGEPGEYYIANGLLSVSTTTQPEVDGATIALGSDGQCMVPSEAVALKYASKAYSVPAASAGVMFTTRTGWFTYPKVGLWAYDVDRIPCLYVDTSAGCNAAEYTAPAATAAAGMQKLYPVEGIKGLFHGKIKARSTGYYGEMQLIAHFASTDGAEDGVVLSPAKIINAPNSAKTGISPYSVFPRFSGSYYEGWGVKDPDASDGYYDANHQFDFYVWLSEYPQYNSAAKIKHFEATERDYEQPENVVYFVGAANDWSNRGTDPDYWLAPKDNNIYERVIYIPAGEDTFRLFLSPGTWRTDECMAAGWPDFEDILTPTLGDNMTVTLEAVRGSSNWKLNNWEGGYLRVQADKSNYTVKLSKADGPETSTPLFHLPEADFNSLHYYNGTEFVKIPKVGARQFEGTVNMPAGRQDLYFVMCREGNDPTLYSDIDVIYSGYPRAVLTDDDLNAAGDTFSHTARYYTYTDDRNIYGSFLTPEYWEGGDVKVKVDMNTHNITFEAPASGIESVRADDQAVAPVLRGIYTLTGVKIERPVDSLPAGIYIIDGQKRVVR